MGTVSSGVPKKSYAEFRDSGDEVEATSEEEYSDEEPPAKKKSPAKGRGRPAKSGKSPAAKPKVTYKEDSEDEFEVTSEEEFSDDEPPAKKKKSPAKGRG